MARPPRVRKLNRDDFKDAPQELLPTIDAIILLLNESLLPMADALSGNLSREDNFASKSKVDLEFTTQPVLSNTVLRFAHGMFSRPRHIVCSSMARSDGVALSAAWSIEWGIAQDGQVEVRFQGLPTSVKHKASFLME